MKPRRIQSRYHQQAPDQRKTTDTYTLQQAWKLAVVQSVRIGFTLMFCAIFALLGYSTASAQMGGGGGMGGGGMGGGGMHGGGRHGGGKPGGGRDGEAGDRESAQSRMQQKANDRLTAKLAATGYCRSGFTLMDSQFERGHVQLSGYCNEKASAADRTAYPNDPGR